MHPFTPGARAALALDLQVAERKLNLCVSTRNALIARAEEARALAAEPGRQTVSRNQEFARLRAQAAGMLVEISGLREEVARLEGRLAREAEPVVLSAEQVRAMDETAGIAA